MILRFDGGLSIATLVLGDFATNCYVLVLDSPGDSPGPPTCWVVDPGLGVEALLHYLGGKGLTPRRVLLTHCHGDHIAGVGTVKDAWPDAALTAPAREAAHLSDPMMNLSGLFGFHLLAPAPDETVSPGDELAMGAVTWRVLGTPGHTPGGLCFHCPAAGVVLTGDTLFAAGIGRTDLPGGDTQTLLNSIREVLMVLPDETRVLPGHGPPTTIGTERESNPFLRAQPPGGRDTILD
ncbi:MAG: MBL fold metallo-hydrolase [Planctomycetota bacterium]|jgi:glyoxylase-like metal-dependent hydrolase (beta-lactamase superfamily II)